VIIFKVKKAQQEIVGLVVIVLIVSVMGLVFLSFMIGRGEVIKDSSVGLENLLDAEMMKSSNCAINFVPEYDNIEELAKSCYENRVCLNSNNSCEVLEKLLREDIGKGLEMNVGSVNKGFELSVRYRDVELEDLGDEIISLISEGVMDECSSKIGASRLIDVGFGSGVIEFNLRVCRG